MTEELKLKKETKSHFCLIVCIGVVLDEMLVGIHKEHPVQRYL